MKKLTLSVVALLMLAITCRVQAQDDAMMKAWQAYMTPGDVHKMIANDDGKWDGEVTMWMAPGAPPTKSKTSSTNSMIMGGRYQKSIHEGNMMGMPFEGMSLLGYDNSKKTFVSTWIDNMGTGMMNMEGTWDDATKTINFKGKCVDPMTGKDMDVREVFKFVDKDHQVMEMYCNTDGKEMKTMEIQFSRRK
ncbi:hypothetical protein AQ505_24060 [Pedobacter sp. PACM 27299]|uniref:DUF1579 domain-containing protein n=1 Tax=Pedobacter sp. PACM 27299 TaxID=1727164 RepID=UPI000706D0AD|nr:DUF1579 domain-containing protein [Pedobacter sp. PACM 27299]ALL08280.1 hypothetical protein AQ505_24060 [Pedobacter sp. PACM 27299]